MGFKLPLVDFELPFVGRIFWKILPAVFALAFLVFFVAIRFFGYELTNADVGGSIISGVLLAYLLHLWTLPAEEFPDIAGLGHLDDEHEGQDHGLDDDHEHEHDATDQQGAFANEEVRKQD